MEEKTKKSDAPRSMDGKRDLFLRRRRQETGKGEEESFTQSNTNGSLPRNTVNFLRSHRLRLHGHLDLRSKGTIVGRREEIGGGRSGVSVKIRMETPTRLFRRSNQ